jgi:hypothetical protein
MAGALLLKDVEVTSGSVERFKDSGRKKGSST